MKKLLCLLSLVGLVAGIGIAYAGQPAATGITGSIHDMNVFAAVGGEPDEFGRSCVFCHTPHNATKTDDDLATPLWNHELTTLDFSEGVYQWATPENYPLAIDDPLVGPSRLCMSCHDGSVAVDQHGPSRASLNHNLYLSGDTAVGKNGDLTDDHPIGFSYGLALSERNTQGLQFPELVEKGELFASAVTASTQAGRYDTVVRAQGGRTIGDVLYQGDIMTCASCHEVHNKENVVQDVGTKGYQPNYLLYAKEKASLICLSCHIK